VLVKSKQKEEPKTQSGVLIPEGAKLKDNSRYQTVSFVCAATDCERFLQNLNSGNTWATATGTRDDVFVSSAKNNGSCSLVVDKSMIEEVVIDGKKFEIVHQNYVVGVIDE
jgi:co-chaperonin GroES (HSP10)